MLSVNKVNLDDGIFSYLDSNSIIEKKGVSDFFGIFSSISNENLINKNKFENVDPNQISNENDFSFLSFIPQRFTKKPDDENEQNFNFSELNNQHESLDSILSSLDINSPKINQSKADELVQSIVSKLNQNSKNESLELNSPTAINEESDVLKDFFIFSSANPMASHSRMQSTKFIEVGDNLNEESNLINNNKGNSEISSPIKLSISDVNDLANNITDEITNKLLAPNESVLNDAELSNNMIGNNLVDNSDSNKIQIPREFFKQKISDEISKLINETFGIDSNQELPKNLIGKNLSTNNAIKFSKNELNSLAEKIADKITKQTNIDFPSNNLNVQNEASNPVMLKDSSAKVDEVNYEVKNNGIYDDPVLLKDLSAKVDEVNYEVKNNGIYADPVVLKDSSAKVDDGINKVNNDIYAEIKPLIVEQKKNIINEISKIIFDKLGINLDRTSINNNGKTKIKSSINTLELIKNENQLNINKIDSDLKIEAESKITIEGPKLLDEQHVSSVDLKSEVVKESDNLSENLLAIDQWKLNGDNNFNQSNNNSQKQSKTHNPIIDRLHNIDHAQNSPILKTESKPNEANTVKTITYISKLSELSNKINTIVSKSTDGETNIARINLTPKTLGTLVVEISQSKDDLKITINAESKDVANIIEQNISGLKEKLINQGINSPNIELNINVQTQAATLMNKGENREDKGSTRHDKRQSKYSKSSELLSDMDQSTINYTRYDSGKFIEKYI